MVKKFKLFSQLASVYRVFTQMVRYLQKKIPTTEFDPLNPRSAEWGSIKWKDYCNSSVVVKYVSDYSGLMARRNVLSSHIPQILSMPSSPTTAREITLPLFHARFLDIYY